MNNGSPMSPDELRLRRKKQALLRKKQAKAERKRKFIKALVFVAVFIFVFAFYEQGLNLNFNFDFKFNGFKFNLFKNNKKGDNDKEVNPVSKLEGKFIAYVPMDDRSIHTTRVVYLAESSGYDLKMPDMKFYKTYLTSGENSYNGFNTKFGNPAKIASWLLEMEDAGCDYYILSLDQMFSGGIVGSQYLSDKDLSVYEKGLSSSKKVLEKIVSDKKNHVYLVDSVMGLSATPGFLDFTADDLGLLVAYTNVPRPLLDGGDLTIDKIAENYGNGADGTSLSTELDIEKVNRYLAARERKLEYSKYVIGVLGDLEDNTNVHLYYGIDNSGNSDNNIQRNDIAFIRSTAQSNNVEVSIYDGVSSLYEEAYAEMVMNAIDRDVKVQVRYYGDSSLIVGGTQKNYTTVMSELTSKLGVSEVESGADMEVLVYTYNGPETQDAASRQLINQYLYNIKHHIPTVIINDADYMNDQYLMNYLIDYETNKVPLTYMVGYSNWGGFVNSSRIGLSSGVVRYLYLKQDNKKDDCDRGFSKLLAKSFVEDIAYLPSQGSTDIRALQATMDSRLGLITKNLKTGNIITNLIKYEENGLKSVEAYNYKFSWGRASEIDFDISVQLDDDRHSINLIETF